MEYGRYILMEFITDKVNDRRYRLHEPEVVTARLVTVARIAVGKKCGVSLNRRTNR